MHRFPRLVILSLCFTLLLAAFIIACSGDDDPSTSSGQANDNDDSPNVDDDDNDDAGDDDDLVELTWVDLPGGPFAMGCADMDASCQPDEFPARTVTVGAFALTATPITQAQYAAVTGENPSFFTGCDDCPVESVDYTQAQAFCAAVGGRLPTEAEWEYAARAGGATRFICGDGPGCLRTIAWYEINADKETHPVGKMEKNGFDLYDMSGNVWEWVNDWYGELYYQEGPAVDPTGPAAGLSRVLRGGAFNNAAFYLRVSFRNYSSPTERNRVAGFRCARDR
ncbi:MAG TPA: formylglycine-generating enzyme family protein [bacterium]|nr:formylglycine-generating enzyme family protein [bacterium]